MTQATCIVLLVENDENDVGLIARAFQKASLPHTLRAVRSYEEAISYLSGEGPYADRTRHPVPSLVLLDLKLRGRSGFECLQWMRGRPEFKRVPAVVLSSSKEMDDVNRAYDLGAASYLVKPVGSDDLLAIVKSLGTYWLIFNRYPDPQAR